MKLMVSCAINIVVVSSCIMAAMKYSGNNVLLGIFLEAVLAVLACAVVYVSMNRIIGPIMQLKDRIIAMAARGDFSAEVPVFHTGDEVEELSQAVLELQQAQIRHLNDLSRILQAIAHNNLNVEVGPGYRGDYFRQKEALESIIGELNQSIRQIRMGAVNIAAATANVSSGVQEVSLGASQQNDALEELTGALEGFRGQVGQNAADAKTASDLSVEAGKQMMAGNAEMARMLEAMGHISKTSQKIAQVIKTVDDIAFQTNILALNASVEAARAGAAGKGFAVVAEEVRSLANRSAEASKGTSGLIEDALRAVEVGEQTAKGTAEMLAQVMEKAKTATGLTLHIAEAAARQEREIAGLSEALGRISSVVQANSAAAQQGAASSQEMSAQAQMLKEMVARYTLRGDARAPLAAR